MYEKLSSQSLKSYSGSSLSFLKRYHNRSDNELALKKLIQEVVQARAKEFSQPGSLRNSGNVEKSNLLESTIDTSYDKLSPSPMSNAE